MRYVFNDNEMYNRTAIDMGLDWEEEQRRLCKKGMHLANGEKLTCKEYIELAKKQELVEGALKIERS